MEQLNTFLGFTNYYRKFINKYEALTTPIENLFDNGDEKFRYKKKTKIIEWNEQANECFEKLKLSLTSPSILSYPTKCDVFILDTDAPHSGIGAVLSQVQNGKECVMEFASKN